MTKHVPPPAAAEDGPSLACLRLGWAMVALFLALGLALESFHLVKLPFYLDLRLRRELWTLAHAHGTLLGAVNVLFGRSAARLIAHAGQRLLASRLLRAGAVLVPAGFFLGGFGAAEGDPSLFIVLVPTGALLALAGVGILVAGIRHG
jgi:hypothetical protein